MLDSWMGRGQKGSDAQNKTQDKVGLGSIRRPVIGLALGGGAARGFAHIGIIRTLVAHGIMPNVVVGTSIGAVVGGAYAAGHLDKVEDWARSLQPRTVLSYLDIRLNGSGLIGGSKLAAELETALGKSLIEELPVKFATVATEVRTGHEIWLTHGPMVDAMRASYALPGIYSHGPTPGVSVSVMPEAVPEPETRKRGIGKFFSAERTMKREFFGGGGRPGISSVMIDAFNIMQDRITRARLAGDPPDLLISPRVGKIGWFDFHRADELIAHGARAAERAIESIQEAIHILAPEPAGDAAPAVEKAEKE